MGTRSGWGRGQGVSTCKGWGSSPLPSGVSYGEGGTGVDRTKQGPQACHRLSLRRLTPPSQTRLLGPTRFGRGTRLRPPPPGPPGRPILCP